MIESPRLRSAATTGRTDDNTPPDPVINSIDPLNRRGLPQITAPKRELPEGKGKGLWPRETDDG